MGRGAYAGRPGPMLHHTSGGPDPSIQDVSGRNKRPSKYKEVEPTSAADLKQHLPRRYPGISDQARRHVGQGDCVLISFINREDVWIHLEEADDDIVCGRITNKVTKVAGLQIGQLVKFRRDCIADVADDDDDDSD